MKNYDIHFNTLTIFQYIQEYYDNFDLRAPMPGCNPDHTRTLIMQSVLKLKDSTRVSTHLMLDISFDTHIS